MKTEFNCPACKNCLITDEDFTELYCPKCNKSTDYWDFVTDQKEAVFQ